MVGFKQLFTVEGVQNRVHDSSELMSLMPLIALRKKM